MQQNQYSRSSEKNGIDVAFCQKIPKIELHAHLNGSVSQKTLQKLHLLKNGVQHDELTLKTSRDNPTYEDAFNIFTLLHSLVQDTDTVELIAKDVIEEFYSDNVFYLELRSTPKKYGSLGKADYVLAILSAIKKCQKTCPEMTVAFLVSIDRARGLVEAKENLALSIEFNKKYQDIVLGIEFSGNPEKGDVNDYLPLFAEAKENGLVVSLHLGEVLNEKENALLLSSLPHRIGHAVFVHPESGGTDDLFNTVRVQKVPIEICLTSNVIGRITESYDTHPIKKWYDLQHPIIICTDDKGLFQSTLSHEYWLAAQTLNLSQAQVLELSSKSIQYIGSSDTVKQRLAALWDEKIKLIGLL